MKNKKLIVAIIIMAVAVAMAIVGFIILPDTLVVQINAAGQASNTMPKILGILIPFLLCIVFSVLYLKTEKSSKSLIISLIGLVAFALLFIFNL